jgi:hypothetical protein
MPFVIIHICNLYGIILLKFLLLSNYCLLEGWAAAHEDRQGAERGRRSEHERQGAVPASQDARGVAGQR